MKAILVNGSPRASGNTSLALKEIEGVLVEEGFEVTRIQVGHLPIRGCLACGKCHELGRCVIDDAVNRDAALFREADAVVFASPVYYGMANGTLVSYLQRLFYSSHIDWRYKVGAAVAVAPTWRRLAVRTPPAFPTPWPLPSSCWALKGPWSRLRST